MAPADDFRGESRTENWQEVYDRQAARGDLIDRCDELLGLPSRDRVLELGCGPGYTTAQLVERVRPGVVFAVDRQPAALRFLRSDARVGIEHVRLIAGDLEALPLRFSEPIPTLMAFVLHHLDAPDLAIGELHRALPAPSPLLVVEYNPAVRGDVGPPLEARIRPAAVESWLTGAGFTVERTADLPEEKYAVLASR